MSPAPLGILGLELLRRTPLFHALGFAESKGEEQIGGPRTASWYRDGRSSFLRSCKRTADRDCPKRGTSNAASVHLAGIWRVEWTEKPLFGGPPGYAASSSEAFRTVSEGAFHELRL
jgi:hypothetical protein